jgi:serine/threonine-protein kinase
MGDLQKPIFPAGYVAAERYEVVRMIGAGAMGSVHEALDRLLKKRVAIKFLDPSLARDEQLIKRFAREAQAAAQVRHDNVCDVSDLGVTEDKTPFLVMELLDGEPLDRVLKRLKKLPLDRAVTIALQMLSALKAAHEQGIVHRDLKPGNVILTRASDGREKVKLIDFGIAKFLDGAASVAATSTGTIVGSPVYMSPEQAGGKVKEIDHRTDIWAVGVILYVMLTGELPFPGDNVREVFAKIFFDDPKPPREIEPSIPPAIEAVILGALAKDKEERHASAGELSAALIDSLDPELAAALEVGDTDPEERRSSLGSLVTRLDAKRAGELESSLSPTNTTGRRTRRSRVLTAAVVFGFLLLAGGGAVVLLRPDFGAGERPVIPVMAPAAPAPRAEAPPPAEPAPVEPVESAPTPVRVDLVGLPAGARVRFAGAAVQGSAIEGPDGTEGLLQVAAEGYRPYDTRITLSHGMRVDVGRELRPESRSSSRRHEAGLEGTEPPVDIAEDAPPAPVEPAVTPPEQPAKRPRAGQPRIVGGWED